MVSAMEDTAMAKPLLPDELWERIQPLLALCRNEIAVELRRRRPEVSTIGSLRVACSSLITASAAAAESELAILAQNGRAARIKAVGWKSRPTPPSDNSASAAHPAAACSARR